MKAVEKAYVTIRRGILEGAYPAASRITEQEVAALSGVSRTPVREALRRLQAEGLLVFVPNQGAVVASWNDQEIEEIFALRALLEAYTAQQAALRATPEHVATLKQLARRQYELAAGSRRSPEGYTEIAELNSRFHQTLQDAAGSARLGAMLASLVEVPLVSQTFRSYSPEELLRSARQHAEIAMAVEAGDPDSAAATMRAHVFSARHVFRVLAREAVKLAPASDATSKSA
jgi:DNA-binding GntR family transcriptional regulator